MWMSHVSFSVLTAIFQMALGNLVPEHLHSTEWNMNLAVYAISWSPVIEARLTRFCRNET